MKKLCICLFIVVSLFISCSSPNDNELEITDPEIIYIARKPGGTSWGTIVSLNIMDANGDRHREILSVDDGYISDPKFTKEGDKIVFIMLSDTLGQSENLFLIDYNGMNLNKITKEDTSITYSNPQAIPNSSLILVVVRFKTGPFQIRTVDINSGSQNVIADGGGLSSFPPEMSNDGNYIFYIDNNGNIIRSLWDGSNKTQITFLDYVSQLQLRNKTLYFVSSFSHGLFDLYSIDFNGDGLKRLTNRNDIKYAYLRISNDGSKIINKSLENDEIGIWIMSKDGSNKKKITSYYTWEYDPKFYPSDDKIIFGRYGVQEYNWNNHLLSVDTSGNNLKVLTSNKYDDNISPSFRPIQ